MRAPQAPQVRGSASKIFRIRRAHVLRASLEKSELSRSPARMPGAWLSARTGARDSAPVAIGPVEPLTMASWIGDMRGNSVRPFQQVHNQARGAGARVRGRLQRQRAVIEFLEGIHGQSRAGDVAALGFERSDGDGIDGRSGEDGESGEKSLVRGMDPG